MCDRDRRQIVSLRPRQIVQPRRPAHAADDREIGREPGRISRGEPEATRGFLGRDPAPEPVCALDLGAFQAETGGLFFRAELGPLQDISPDRPRHVSRGSEPYGDGIARCHAGKRQFLADEDRIGRPEHVAIARGPVKPPVFPVADLDPDAAVGTDQLGIDVHPMTLHIMNPDPACNLSARRGGRSINRQRAHPEREDNVALLQAIQTPASEQVRERVQGDRVGVERGRLARHQEAGERTQSDRPRDTLLAHRPDFCQCLHGRAMEQPLLAIQSLGRELAGAGLS